MIYLFIVAVVPIILIAIFGLSLQIGHRFGYAQLRKSPEHKLEVDRVAESAVFGLLALLIAFSFSGAYDRLENRKMHVLTEAVAYSKAYKYIDLLPGKFQDQLRKDIREYLDLHILAYNDIPDLDKVYATLDKLEALQHKIWNLTMEACNNVSKDGVNILVVPAIDEMFNISSIGMNMAKVHPPAIIFVLLIILAASGAFLIGYNSAKNKQRLPIHMICYVLFMAFTIYIIVNIEFPRAGFVRLKYFDHVLIDARDDMNFTPPALDENT